MTTRGGGEPFVLKDMMKMLSYVKSKKFELKFVHKFFDYTPKRY